MLFFVKSYETGRIISCFSYPAISARVALKDRLEHMKRRAADCCNVMYKLPKLADADVTSPTTERVPFTVQQGWVITQNVSIISIAGSCKRGEEPQECFPQLLKELLFLHKCCFFRSFNVFVMATPKL